MKNIEQFHRNGGTKNLNSCIYLIVGRTASGKDFFAKQLQDKQGLEGVLSRTTRPKRSKEDCSHIFVTPERAKKEMFETIASTKINGYLYYALPEDLKDKRWYIVDVEGALQLIRSMKHQEFEIIHIKADSRQKAKQHYIERGGDEEEYLKRMINEDLHFAEFERALPYFEYRDGKSLPDNVNTVWVITNTYEETCFNDMVYLFE